MPRLPRLPRASTHALLESLRAMLASIDAGALDSSTTMRCRLQGAITALEVVLGERASLLDGLTDDDSE